MKQDEIMYTFSWAVGIFLGMTIRYEQGNKEDFKKNCYWMLKTKDHIHYMDKKQKTSDVIFIDVHFLEI